MANNRFIRLARVYLREIDPALLLAVFALLVISVINMYGILGSDHSILRKQVLFIFLGIFVLILFSFFNYRYLKNYTLPVLSLYILSLILLVLTFYSQSVRGTNSWLVFGSLTFEPAELTKLCLIILMAKYFSQKHNYINQFRHVIAASVYFLIPVGLILNQPDLGSAIILSFIWLSLLFAAGINRKQIIALVLVGAVAAAGAWFLLLKPYQKARVASFLDQTADPLGIGYNLTQSKIAIGSGFWFGNGLGKGSQANLGFLPEPHNDFIFAAYVEQFGFVGALVLLGLIVFIVYRILLIGSSSNSNFGKLFAIGLAVFIFSHAFVSAGVNVGILPVTGLPFPFLSAGGSNLILIMTGLGILQSIKRYG